MKRTKKTKKARPAPDGWRNRIVQHANVDPRTLKAHPQNWRVHTDYQRAALSGVLDQVGWVQDVIVNRTTGCLLNGHLRVELAVKKKEPTVPVVYVELTEAEEKLVLASLDPIAALALTDQDLLAGLVGEIGGTETGLDALFQSLLEESAAVTTKEMKDPDEPVQPRRKLGDRQTQIKPVLYADQVALFERALKATGELNRGKALLIVCQFYLKKKHGSEERQLDIHTQGALA